MKKFEYVMRGIMGFHARPAVLIVDEARKFKSKITIYSNGRHANAAEVFDIMSLTAKRGQAVLVEVDGEDEELAAEAILNLLTKML